MNLKEEIEKLEKQLAEGKEILAKQTEANKALDKAIRKLRGINEKAQKLIEDSPIFIRKEMEKHYRP